MKAKLIDILIRYYFFLHEPKDFFCSSNFCLVGDVKFEDVVIHSASVDA